MYTCVIVYCILYIAYCILYIVYWILYIVYCICILYMYMYKMYMYIYIYIYRHSWGNIWENDCTTFSGASAYCWWFSLTQIILVMALVFLGQAALESREQQTTHWWPTKKTQTYTVFLTYPPNETHPMANPSCLCLSLSLYIYIYRNTMYTTYSTKHEQTKIHSQVQSCTPCQPSQNCREDRSILGRLLKSAALQSSQCHGGRTSPRGVGWILWDFMELWGYHDYYGIIYGDIMDKSMGI